jgi:hypothetical protein
MVEEMVSLQVAGGLILFMLAAWPAEGVEAGMNHKRFIESLGG